MDQIQTFLQTHQIPSYKEQIRLIKTENQEKGIQLAKDFLYTVSDKKTALFLSGGKTPKDLYEQLANEKKLTAGIVALVDERFGSSMHEKSNEKMIASTGLLAYFDSKGIPFYPIVKRNEPSVSLQNDMVRENSALQYDETLRYLLNNFPKSIAVLGLGRDGHIAGIAGMRADFHNPMLDAEQKEELVGSFDDTTGMFGERITMTFAALSQIDLLLVLVFGKEKEPALLRLFADDKYSETEIPAKFLKRPEIAKKTLIITDQRV